MRPTLDDRNIALVFINGDTVQQNAAGRKKHGANAVILSDHDLCITDLYNLRNTRNVAPKPGVIVDLPIPTTFLVDENGIVRWIDQAEDYMLRSDPGRVLQAIEENLKTR